MLLGLAALVLAACGNNNMGTDSGPPDTGAIEMDSGPPAPRAAAATAVGADSMIGTSDDVLADFSCMGTAMAPTGGADATFTANIADFMTGAAVDMIDVDIFPDNVVTDGCSGTCVRMTSDAMGNLPGTAPAGGWMAYRVAAGGMAPGDPVLTIGYNRVVPMMGGMIELPAVSNATIGAIPAIYRRTRLPGTAIVSGSITDCAGDEVANARLRVFRGATEVLPGPAMTDFFVGYFNGMSGPSPSRVTTHVDGIYAAANLDPAGGPVRVELWAPIVVDGAEMRLACEEIRVFANAVTIISVGPARGDYPAGHGCAP
jgi:hypothetical protein